MKRSPQADLADIASEALVPIPDFGGPSCVRKNHPAAALYAPCETPEYGTPAWDEAERKRALIIALAEDEDIRRIREHVIATAIENASKP